MVRENEAAAEPAIKAVKEGDIRFVPDRFAKIYFNWMENIQDWCISRQLWWGHRIPAYYCGECGEMMVGNERPGSCSNCGSETIEQDPDTLDTWFSSALWPFSAWLAGRNRRPQVFLPDKRACYRLRYHILLGGRMIFGP